MSPFLFIYAVCFLGGTRACYAPAAARPPGAGRAGPRCADLPVRVPGVSRRGDRMRYT